MRRILIALFLLAATACPSRAQLAVASYSLITGAGTNYPDSGGELTNGIASTVAWGAGVSIAYEDVAPMVGWDNTNPVIRFNFAAPVTIRALTAWFADSNGHAGVTLPSAVTLTTTGGFSQSFSITDPAGDGTTVPFSFSGFEVLTSDMTLTASRSSQWTFLSEVYFYDSASAIPEPAASALGFAAVAFGGTLLWRRRRRLRRAG